MTLYQEFGELHPLPPFDFNRSLAFLNGFEPTQQEQVLGAGILTKAASVNGQAVVYELRSTGTIMDPCLSYNLYSEQNLTREVEQRTTQIIGHFLSLDDDLSPFYALGQDDPYFQPVLDQLYGYHQVKFPSPFENACWAILSQRTPYLSAIQQKQALRERYGPFLAFHRNHHQAFPEPAVLASLEPGDLLALVGTERRAGYILGLAQAFAGLDLAQLITAPFDEAYNWLISIPGIGPWSASFILIRGLGRMERLPVNEKRLDEEIAYWYGKGRTLKASAIQEIADYYGPWKGYWAHYLRAATHPS